MKATWQRIEQWLLNNAKPVQRSLAPGATDSELRSAEATVGLTFPVDFFCSYTIHNGQVVDRVFGTSPRFIYGDSLYPLEKIVGCWNDLKDLPDELAEAGLIRTIGPVKPIWNSPLRLPIAGDDSTHYYFMDFDPAPGGQVGQIVLSFHDDPRIECVAASFGEWLERFASQLEAGRYVYSSRRNGLLPIEWADD